MWIVALLACSGDEYTAPDVVAFDARTAWVTGEVRDGEPYIFEFLLKSGAKEACRLPEAATLEVNGVRPSQVDVGAGPGLDCYGSSVLYREDAIAELAATGPDAELRLSDDVDSVAVTFVGLLGEQRLVIEPTTVVQDGTISVRWDGALPFGQYDQLYLAGPGEEFDGVDLGPDIYEEVPDDGAWSFSADRPVGPARLDWGLRVGTPCTGDVPCDDRRSALGISGTEPLTIE